MLNVDHLSVTFQINRKKPLQALDDVSFQLQSGETLGIVGESGCGKSTLARAITQLLVSYQGTIEWNGKSLANLNKKQQKINRGDIQLIFQDPLDALNPRLTIAEILMDPLRYLATHLSKRQCQQRIEKILQLTGLSKRYLQRYPHEFSGGQCQRIGIARAMMVQPKLLICDEPVSALDVSIQAQIINLLIDLQQQQHLSLLFISHDLHIVRHISQRILVLYRGQIMELAETDALYHYPQHPYTKMLLDAVPLLDPKREKQRMTQRIIAGLKEQPKQALDDHQGCVFYSRCHQKTTVCLQEKPVLKALSNNENHRVRCHYA